MRTPRSTCLCAVAMFIATGTVFGQQSDSEQPDPNRPASQRASPETASPQSASPETASSKTASPKTASPKQDAGDRMNVSDNVISWEPMDTHLQVTVSVTGKDFAWQQTFDDHQFPKFDPSEHDDLQPGLYEYSLSYVSNEIVDQKSALESLRTERKDLVQQYEKAIEAGDAEAVKRLYWQANEVRNQVTAMSEQQMQEQHTQKQEEDNDKSVVSKKGRIVIDENGVVSKHSSSEDQEKRRETKQKERQREPSERESEVR